MIEYVIFIGLLTIIYTAFRIVQAKEQKRLKRYYGYRRTQQQPYPLKKVA